jgi:hypothetical protein
MATEQKFNIPVNLTGNEIRNVLLQNLASPPTGAAGLHFFNTSLNAGYVYNGTAWRPMDAALLTDGTIQNSALTTNPLARANHTGTQLAATISNLAATVQAYTLDLFAAPATSLSVGSQRVINLATGVAGTDAVNVAQLNAAVQSVSAGISGKGSCVAVSTTNVASMSGTGITVDGVALNTVGMRVLLSGQTAASQNGPWVISAGSWTRPTTDANNELETGALWFIEQGTTNAATQWWLNSPVAGVTITPGTTAIGIVKFGAAASYTAAAPILLTGSVFSLTFGNGLANVAGVLVVDTTIVARKYSTLLATSATSYTVTHNLGTKNVQVSIMNTATGDIENAYVNVPTTNTVTIGFSVAPAANVYQVTVIG